MYLKSVLAFGLVFMIGCEGDLGLTGPEGPAGPPGADGSDGSSGPGPVPPAYLAANGLTGGAAYSKWWTAAGGGSDTQPTTVAGADFYRCKACHAWDGLGNAASYATRTGQSTLKSSRPDVSGVNLRSTAGSESIEELYDLVAHVGARQIDAADNTHPDFDAVLTVDQIWDIVKFMREEWVNPSELYDIAVTGPKMYVDYTVTPAVVVAPTITYTNVGAKGDAARGNTLYENCESCHGTDGTLLDIGGRSLGQFIREKPHEAWFKAKFGEPGTGMEPGLVTELQDLQDLYAALANPVFFPDLP